MGDVYYYHYITMVGRHAEEAHEGKGEQPYMQGGIQTSN